MDVAATGIALISLVGFVIAILVVLDFILLGHRVQKIRKELEKQSAQIEQQNRYLAAIAGTLARPAAPAPPRAA
jgi:cell division protein ZapA (FtsZ GTPase activity inhibitor)